MQAFFNISLAFGQRTMALLFPGFYFMKHPKIFRVLPYFRGRIFKCFI